MIRIMVIVFNDDQDQGDCLWRRWWSRWHLWADRESIHNQSAARSSDTLTLLNNAIHTLNTEHRTQCQGRAGSPVRSSLIGACPMCHLQPTLKMMIWGFFCQFQSIFRGTIMISIDQRWPISQPALCSLDIMSQNVQTRDKNVLPKSPVKPRFLIQAPQISLQ